MGSFKKNEKGFGAVEAVLIIVIIVLIGAVGYLVYKNHHKTPAKVVTVTKTVTAAPKSTTTTTSTTKTYTDPSSTYSLVYPNTWTVAQSGAGDQPPATVINKLETTFTAPGAPDIATNDPNTINVIAYQTSDEASIFKFYASGTSTTPENLTINGYPAMYQQSVVDSSGGSSYTDDNYVVTNNGVTIDFNFREQQGAITYAASPQDNVPAFNDSSLVPAYASLVKSVKFLN